MIGRKDVMGREWLIANKVLAMLQRLSTQLNLESLPAVRLMSKHAQIYKEELSFDLEDNFSHLFNSFICIVL